MGRALLLAGVALLAPQRLPAALTTPEERAQSEPLEPFRIAGNVYYVGAREVTSYLIATPQGHILVDVGFEDTAPQVLRNIETLGFRPADVKLLLTTQAHYDHVGGIPAVRARTGARLVMSAGNAALAARGGAGDPNFGDRFLYPPFTPDGGVVDGQEVKLGGSTLVAHLTPGHTPGCTTWTMEVRERGKPLRVVILCSVTAPGYRLVDNAAYPHIADDYAESFRRLAALPADVMLAAHGSMFDLVGKRERLSRNPEQNPFVDPQEWPRYIARARDAFERQLHEQQQAAANAAGH